MVERAEPGPDGRERPWRATADSIDLQPAADAAPAAATPLLLGFVREIERALRAFLALPRTRRRSGVVRRGVVRLTVEQAAAMNREIEEVLTRYDALEAASPQAPRWDVFYLALPGEPDDTATPARRNGRES